MQRFVDTLGRTIVSAVIGIAFTAGVAFSADWLVTAETMGEHVLGAKVATLSQLCEQRAYHHWTVDRNRPVAKLAGWENERRLDLAAQFVPETANEDELRHSVVQACSHALQPA